MWNQALSPIQRPGSVSSTQSSVNVSSKGFPHSKNVFCVGEELKIAVNIALERFRLSEDQQELDFPSSLTSNERAYIHKLCANYGFKSRSKGKGSSRYLTVLKKDSSLQLCAMSNIHLVRNSRHQIQNLLQKNPITLKERQELQQRVERNQMSDSIMKEIAKTTTGRLNNGVAQIPPPCSTSYEFASVQESLPVNTMKEVIVKSINDNKVILIVGETGSGKTTQIPQMILNDCQANNKPCRIFCTQPRRLSALTIAERVAAERGEKIGQSVGYQIRLESRVSPKTILTFCTNGVLLRTLMAGDQTISYVTHIIVDEVHERDRFCDFLLIVLKELLPKIKHLRLILMSANINTHLFMSYFSGCSVLHVPGRLFDVQDYFLEDILKWTNYTNKEMEKRKNLTVKADKVRSSLDEWCNKSLLISKMESMTMPITEPFVEPTESAHGSSDPVFFKADVGPEKEELEPWLVKELDNLLSEIWLNGKEENFSQVFNLILNENVSVDYKHSEMSVTPLMVSSGRGFVGVVEKLLNMGANIYVRSSNDWKAIDWAQKFDQTEVVELLEAHMAAMENCEDDESNLLNDSEMLSQEDKELLNLYHSTFDDDKVDINLIVSLLHKIHSLPQPGAILVFLPGYDEIMTLREKIHEHKNFSENSRFILYILHSQMQSTEQKNIFKIPEPGTRKIILSTNIAETSITVNDVVFVIDSGKVKVKSYDALTSVSMLKTQWISKSSVSQRSGRAGRCRPGIAYHLFSSVRYQNMLEHQVPEILCYPLQELCLHTKLLAPPNCKIGDFLARAPEPPASLVVKNAVHLLKQIDALDPFEDLTELGHHLADLPVEPRYGKMILYSVVLKCLDPILTIACSLAYKDPFLLPNQPYQKRAAAMSRRRFAAGTFSDHMALLRAFQGWQKARIEGWEKSFCEKNFLSSSTMEMIVSMRTQLLGQLRAAGFVRARGGGDIRDLNSNSENWSVVKAALCAGMYPNLIKVDRERACLMTSKESKIHFHSSSVLVLSPNELGFNMHNTAVSHLPTDWLAFEEMTRMHRTVQVRSCTAVTPITVALFAGPARLPSEVIQEAESISGSVKIDSMSEAWISDSEEDEVQDDAQPKRFLKLDDWIRFSFEPGVSAAVVQLRLKWHSLFMRRMRAPTKLWSQYDECTVRTIVGVLTNEEQSLGLQQPAGIGQRPRPMCNETSVMSGGYKDKDTASYPFDSNSCHELRREDVGTKMKEYGNELLEERISSLKLNNSHNVEKQSAVPQSSSTNQLQFHGFSTEVKSSYYFLAKAPSARILTFSEMRKFWPATGNYDSISKLIKEGKSVYFIFSIHGSGHFYGYARVVEFVVNQCNRELPGCYYSIEWIKKYNIPFYQCQSIMASIFDKKVLTSSDFQELDSNIGEQLVRLWDKCPSNVQGFQNSLLLDLSNQDSVWSSTPKQGGNAQGFPGHPHPFYGAFTQCEAPHTSSQAYAQQFYQSNFSQSHLSYPDKNEK